MIRRFEEFTRNIAMAYKYVIRIKAYEMNTFGLKGSHVMCLYYIGKNPHINRTVYSCRFFYILGKPHEEVSYNEHIKGVHKSREDKCRTGIHET